MQLIWRKTKMKLLVNGKQFAVNVLEASKNTILFEIDNKNYFVEIDNSIDHSTNLKKSRANSKIRSKKTIAKSTDRLLAEIPGLVASIKVNAGDKVKTGDTLIILEAMKMQNRVTAPKECQIKEVVVFEGQEISKGQILVIFE